MFSVFICPSRIGCNFFDSQTLLLVVYACTPNTSIVNTVIQYQDHPTEIGREMAAIEVELKDIM